MVTPLEHADGMPLWIDIIVDSKEKRLELQAFLNTLFDWTWEEGSPENGFYTIASFNGQPVMAVGQGDNAPGKWTVYFKTSDIEATAKKAQDLGATLDFPVMPVGPAGTMAVLTDPQGARFGLWQGNEFHGFNIAYEPNAPGWFDHVSDDPEGAGAFYVALTGQEITTPDHGMQVLHHGEQWFASVSHDRVAREPRWNPIFVVSALEPVRDRVEQHGGSVLIAELEAPGTLLTVFTEPVNNSVMTVIRAGQQE